jgi:hypothetical protein
VVSARWRDAGPEKAMDPRLYIKGAHADGVRTRMKHDIAAATAGPYG